MLPGPNISTTHPKQPHSSHSGQIEQLDHEYPAYGHHPITKMFQERKAEEEQKVANA